MTDSARKIIAASRAQRQQQERQADTNRGEEAGAGRGGGRAPANGEKVARRGVLPGSFVVQLEAWKSKHEGEEGVTDDLVGSGICTVSQSQVVIFGCSWLCERRLVCGACFLCG